MTSEATSERVTATATATDAYAARESGRRRRGITIAVGAALISGIAVFVNGYGVAAVPDATVYTTAKNLVAATLLAGLAGAGLLGRTGRRPTAVAQPRRPTRLVGLLAVGVIGGSLPFVLFFEGLARAGTTQAAFLHKTLIVWVALLGVPLLGERLRAVHMGAIALLLSGQVVLGGGIGGWAGSGELLILAATLLWAVEVIVAKRLLRDLDPATLGVARMGIGVLLLVGWVAVSGRWNEFVGLNARGWGWAALTGAILAGYVATWFTALSLAPAIDVTAVLVLAAVVTGLLNVAVKGAALSGATTAGMVLIAAGTVLAVVARPRAPQPVQP